MKKVALFILICFHAYICIGQTVLTKSQLFANPEWENPSMAGMSDQLKLGFLYKQSINNSGDNISYVETGLFMPLTNTLNRENDNSNFILSAPSLTKQNENNNGRKKHGIGINFSTLKLNGYQLNNLKLSYAYHLPVSKTLNLSFGVGVNARQTRFDVGNFTVEDSQNDLFYQKLINSSFSGTLLLGSVGMSLYSSNMFLTATLNNIKMYENGNINTETNTSIIQTKISAAYKYAINSNFYVIPHASYHLNQQFEDQLLYNLRLNFKNQVYAGLGGENSRKISFMFGVKLPKAIFLDYAFDHYVNYGQIVAKGVHEIGLTYIFNNKTLASPFLW